MWQHNILKTIWCMYIILSEYESVWPEVWPQNKCRSLWPIFHGPVIVSYSLKTVSCMNIIIWDYESVWSDSWHQNECRSLWPIFHGLVILRCILKIIWYLGIIGQYDLKFDLKINVCHCDLYFMVHWFCLISQRLFDGWVSYFQIMRKCDPNLDLKINTDKYRSTWPVFHGLVILLNILKIVWLMNIINGIMDQCDTKIDLIKYGSVILLYILKTIWWRNVGIMDQCDTKIDIFKYMWVSDLYFMVHWVFLFHCHRLKLFVCIKKWRQPWVFAPLRALALVVNPFVKIFWNVCGGWLVFHSEQWGGRCFYQYVSLRRLRAV